jgi:predicted nucleic acid-binding Zn ribbon protein
VSERDLSSLKDLLPAVLAQVAKDTGRARQLKPIWDEVVGPQIARWSAPLSLEGSTLVVSVNGSRWVNELAKREGELRERLGKRLGKSSVTKLVFRLAG